MQVHKARAGAAAGIHLMGDFFRGEWINRGRFYRLAYRRHGNNDFFVFNRLHSFRLSCGRLVRLDRCDRCDRLVRLDGCDR